MKKMHALQEKMFNDQEVAVVDDRDGDSGMLRAMESYHRESQVRSSGANGHNGEASMADDYARGSDHGLGQMKSTELYSLAGKIDYCFLSCIPTA
jgi:hypothetical protein